MSLRAILAAKGDEVVSIDSSADLSAAAKLLTKRHIGALVVLDAGERLSGILSVSATSCARWRKAAVPFCRCRLHR